MLADGLRTELINRTSKFFSPLDFSAAVLRVYQQGDFKIAIN
jgi:hypothetical protein